MSAKIQQVVSRPLFFNKDFVPVHRNDTSVIANTRVIYIFLNHDGHIVLDNFLHTLFRLERIGKLQMFDVCYFKGKMERKTRIKF